MNSIFFNAAAAIGLAAVAWVASGFVGGSVLALAVTGVIAAAYLLGVWELRQFRAATASLATALTDLPPSLPGLGDWLKRLSPTLQNAARSRIEGERVGLPGPALTPYLVGLLVMLGMLGTFLGMVLTFKGAVFALEGSSDLQAIRAALAAPIKGLGLSFGTSVAGVAASAMLGLMSAISRRERLDAARLLDTCIATVFRPFSLVHQRQETFKALQQQAHALPDVAARLDAMMERMDQRSQQLDAQLLAQQAQFHREVSVAYTGLADAVGASLTQSLAASARAAGETIQPVVESAMAELAQESRRMHTRLGEAADAQVAALSAQFGATAHAVAEGWTSALRHQADTSEQLVTRLDGALAGFNTHFAQRSAALLDQSEALTQARQAAEAQWLRQQDERMVQQTEAWQRAQNALLGQSEALVQARNEAEARWLQQQGEHLAQQAQAWRSTQEALLGQSEALVQGRTAAEARWLQQQDERMAGQTQAWQAALDALREGWAAALKSQASTSEQLVTQLDDALAGFNTHFEQRSAALLGQSEALVLARTEAEARWLQQQGERMAQHTQAWQSALSALRDDEAARGDAAVARLGELQAALGQHLATLGAALEAPLTRLLQTSAEVPEAAASVMAQLRQETSLLHARDQVALEERASLMASIHTLLQSLNQASVEQRSAIDALLASAAMQLENAGAQHAHTLQAQADKAAEAAVHVASSAVELASLGDVFGQGVQLFNASNDKLVESLQRIEGAISQSTARSDEQLAYYVAQAREVIDLSISAQQGIVEDLRQLQARRAAAPEESLV